MEAEYFNAVKPWELLNLAWSRKGKEDKAPNVLAMIGRSNTLSPWIGIQARGRGGGARGGVANDCVRLCRANR